MNMKISPEFTKELKSAIEKNDKYKKACRAVADRIATQVKFNLPFDTGTARRSTRVVEKDENYDVVGGSSEKNTINHDIGCSCIIAVDYGAAINYMRALGKEPTHSDTLPDILEIESKNTAANKKAFESALK